MSAQRAMPYHEWQAELFQWFRRISSVCVISPACACFVPALQTSSAVKVVVSSSDGA